MTTPGLPFPVVVFDCDGVLLESTAVKTRAFAATFEDFPGRQSDIIAYHLAHAGVARDVKIRAIFQDMLGEPLSEQELARRCDRFGKEVSTGIARCAAVAGLEAAMAGSGPRRRYVASGTPEPELRRVLGGRGLDHWFAGVFGSPATKREILRRIAQSERVTASSLLFVGDSRTDQTEAAAVGATFIGRTSDDTSVTSSPGLPLLRDLHDLATWFAAGCPVAL